VEEEEEEEEGGGGQRQKHKTQTNTNLCSFGFEFITTSFDLCLACFFLFLSFLLLLCDSLAVEPGFLIPLLAKLFFSQPLLFFLFQCSSLSLGFLGFCLLP
jgi:hypothetical protein